MRIIPSTLAVFIVIASAAPSFAQASSPISSIVAARCVQQGLDAAGFSVGAIDGKIGPRSRAAAEAYAKEHSLAAGLLPLSADNTTTWCETLASQDPDVAAFLAAATTYGAASDFRYDIAENVPQPEIERIKLALAKAQTFIDTHLGGGLSEGARGDITVKIVATGRGNEEPGGGGSPATAFSGRQARPFFDVAHRDWNQDTRGRGWTTEADSIKVVVHEYTHVWQGSFGAISGVHHNMPDWVNEGLAEYVAYAAMVASGDMRWNSVRLFMLDAARHGELDAPLDQLRVWPGHAGFLAIDWLISESPNGITSLRILGEEAGRGQPFKTAFEAAFGVSLAHFNEQFELWRIGIETDPANALARRPGLALEP